MLSFSGVHYIHQVVRQGKKSIKSKLIETNTFKIIILIIMVLLYKAVIQRKHFSIDSRNVRVSGKEVKQADDKLKCLML